MRSVFGLTFAARFEPNLAVFVHGDRPPEASEWNRAVAEYRAYSEADSLRVLVYTEGGAPTAAQRAELNSVLGKVRPRIAILTKSMIARVAAKAIQLFVPELRVFEANQVDAALDHLQLTGAARTAARRTLESLRSEFLASRSLRPPSAPR